MKNELLSEKAVLDALDIPDFRHMTKDKVMSFASMLHDMEPEVAIKALEQFPEFAKTISQLATETKAIIDQGFIGYSESAQACSEILQSIIDSLSTQLDRDDISFEERKYYIDRMFEAAKLQSEKDSENKAFIMKVFGIAGGAALFLGGVALAALGGKADFLAPFKKV